MLTKNKAFVKLSTVLLTCLLMQFSPPTWAEEESPSLPDPLPSTLETAPTGASLCGTELTAIYSCLEEQLTLAEEALEERQSTINSTTTDLAQKRLAIDEKMQLQQYKDLLTLKSNQASQLYELHAADIEPSQELLAGHEAAIAALFQANEYTEDYDRLQFEIAMLQKEQQKLQTVFDEGGGFDQDRYDQFEQEIKSLKQQQEDLGLTEEDINAKNNAYAEANQAVLDTYNNQIGLPTGDGGGGFEVGDNNEPVTEVFVNSRHCSVLPAEAAAVLTNACVAVSNRLSFLNTHFAPPESSLMLEGSVKIQQDGTIQIPGGGVIPLPSSGGGGGGGGVDGSTDPTGGSVWDPIIGS